MNTLLDIIKEIECLLWAIIILVAIYMILKNYCLPKERFNHERKMKKEAFDREEKWAGFDKIKESCDDALKKKIDVLNKEKKDLETELETEQYKRGVLEKQLKLYSDIFNQLNVEVKPKEKTINK